MKVGGVEDNLAPYGEEPACSLAITRGNYPEGPDLGVSRRKTHTFPMELQRSVSHISRSSPRI